MADGLVGNRYRLLEVIGRGGMGAVWLAEDELLERRVAVKQVHPPRVSTEEELARVHERVLREARTAARIDHPNAVTIFDVVDDEDGPYVVMEILTGRTLAETIREDGPVSPTQTARIGLALLAALEAAHRSGVVHRDVKPGNVQCCDAERVVLTDFGIAQQVGDSSLTATGDIVGSPAYMSPERARGEQQTPASDLFSLGATLYHAVEGRPPFERETPVGVLTAVVHDPPSAFARAGALRPVITGLLAKNPEDRWTHDRVRAALTEIAQTEPATEATQAMAAVAEGLAPGPATTAEPAGDDRRAPVGTGPLFWRAALVLLVTLGLLGGVGYLLVRDESPLTAGRSDGPFGPGDGGVPSDWTLHVEDGFSIATPPGWRKDAVSGLVRYRSDGVYAYIAVDDPGGDDPRAVLESSRRSFASRSGYEEIAFRDVGFRGRDAVEYEFRYRDGGSDLQASQLAFVEGSRVWVLWFQAKPPTWDEQQRLRSTILSTFTTSS